MNSALSFDFRPVKERIDYVLQVSYGNDSIALIQFMREHLDKHPVDGSIYCLYNDTGWASSWWPTRVENGELLAQRYGFKTARTKSIGMEALVSEKRMWPNLDRFCTTRLKILPSQAWLQLYDPDCQAVVCCGVRREESAERSAWPEWVESSQKHEGRSLWSPLYAHDADARNSLIERSGWQVLPHRSRECRCVLANREDLRRWTEHDISEIERIERELGENKSGNAITMFRPSGKMGAIGIREVIRWAHSEPGKFEALQRPRLCDGGFCEA